MGLAMPDEFLPLEGEAAAQSASAPGRLILRVEGQEEAAAFLAAYAAAAAAEQQQGAAAVLTGAQLPSSCEACGAAAGSGFEAAVRRPVAPFIRDSVIVSAACSSCSAASAEVRSTGGVSTQGSRIRWGLPQAAVHSARCFLLQLRWEDGPLLLWYLSLRSGSSTFTSPCACSPCRSSARSIAPQAARGGAGGPGAGGAAVGLRLDCGA